MTKNKSKRLLSLLLTLVMVFTLTVPSVLADDSDSSGETTTESESGGSTGSTETASAVASIGSTTYDSLESAFESVGDGETITLNADVTVTDATYDGDGYFQVSKKEVTLNLNGHKLSVDTTRILGVKNGGTLHVENGTIEIADGTDSSYKQFNMVRGNSTFTATGVTFDANGIGTYAVYVASGAKATVELTNCTFTDLTSAVVFDADNASTVTLTGCT